MRRLLLTFALALTAGAIVGGRAEAAAFCTYAGGVAGFENCGYRTWEQCLAAISSRRGYCMRNPHDPALWGFDRKGHRRPGTERSWKP